MASNEVTDPADLEDDEIPASELASKIATLTNTIRNNCYGCDIFLCLFMSALKSYRVDRCLRPFPAMFMKEETKDVDTLRKICEGIPLLQTIVKNPQTCSLEVTEFLSWLFCQKDQAYLRKISLKDVNLPSPLKSSSQPHYVFSVVYPEKAELVWKKRKGSRNVFLGYHGSQLDNFYSIFRVGLQHNFDTGKELLYGRGIYLTTEITMSMTYAPFSQSWEHSILGGSKKSIIAVCEVIDDIEKVKCKDSKHKSRSINQGSISGDIPDKYLVVTDSDMIRLKYLFVYKEKTISAMKSWMYNYCLLVSIVFYLMVLFCIGFFQGPTWTRLQKRLYKLIVFKQTPEEL